MHEKKKRNEPPGYFQRCLYYRGRSGALLSEGTRAPRSNDEGEKKLAPPPPPLGSAGGIRAKKKWRLRASVTGQNIRKQPETLLWDKGAMPSVIVRPSKCGKLLLDCCTWRALHTYIHTYVRTYARAACYFHCLHCCATALVRAVYSRVNRGAVYLGLQIVITCIYNLQYQYVHIALEGTETSLGLCLYGCQNEDSIFRARLVPGTWIYPWHVSTGT